MLDDQEIMRRCLDLARKGGRNVSPNPMVGCVIVKSGEIIGEGYHEKFGGPHAEVNAIMSAAFPVEGSDVFVNLEPCSYFGKTPPCVDLLIERKVGKVHVAMLDPNPRVNGAGVRMLRDAGIEVRVGVLGEEARRLNEAFVKFSASKLPFVTLKVAQSLDGRIALMNGRSKYITSTESLRKVHELRAEYDAVLVGAGTIKADNPSLTVRLAEGESPVRIVLDGKLSSPIGSKLFHDRKSRVILFHSVSRGTGSKNKLTALAKLGVELHALKVDGRGNIPLKAVLKRIAAMGIASVLVEGGASVFSQFIRSGMADKLQLFVAPTIIGKGNGFSNGFEIRNLNGAVRLREIETSRLGQDTLVTAYF
jgi:diaminohydroxyphosphoribosylaminopyrimidine deaminase / 5-amino-6-(5-phosphoribosylamino)uracil reductase